MILLFIINFLVILKLSYVSNKIIRGLQVESFDFWVFTILHLICLNRPISLNQLKPVKQK